MSTITIPGGTAELKDDTDLTNKEVKVLRRAARIAMSSAARLQSLGFDGKDPETWKVVSEMTDGEDETIDIFQRTCVITRLVSWTLPDPMPATVDDVDNLLRPLYVALTVAATNIKLGDTFDVENVQDPKADTDSSDS
jgi:hypothetical protein